MRICLMFPRDQIQIMHLCQEQHRSKAVFLLDHIRGTAGQSGPLSMMLILIIVKLPFVLYNNSIMGETFRDYENILFLNKFVPALVQHPLTLLI